MKKILIEGWRGINHSYALVNQYQILALNKLKVDFSHLDLPFCDQRWNHATNFCGFNSQDVGRLNQVKQYTGQDLIDVTYRISYPYRLYPSRGKRLFVFGTSEYQFLSDDMIFQDRPIIKNSNTSLVIITPSNWSKVGFLKAGFKDEQVRVVPHGVDMTIFKPLPRDKVDQFRNLLGANKMSFIILSVGAMTSNKGIDVLLSAYLQLKPKYPQLKLVLKDQSNLYGASANDVIQEFCSNHSVDLSSNEMRDAVGGFFVISDNLSLDQLNWLYNAADCYVSPYRAEGFNLTPLEAAAAGTPIVITRGGSTDDYFHKSFGAQIESTKKTKKEATFLEPELESLIEKLVEQIEGKNSQINQNTALEFIASRFSWEKACTKLISEFGI